MDDREVGQYWEGNAEAWATLARAGYDVCRDHLNTPAFLEMLPGVDGLAGIDLGCGEGHNTRLVARRGARMTGIDIAPTFLRHARQAETDEPLGIDYRVASAQALPFEAGCFDFATAFMSLMDMPEPERAIREACRVLRPGGFFQFSIIHPCWCPGYRKWHRDEAGNKVGVILSDYWDQEDGQVEEWTFGTAPPEARAGFGPFRVPRFCRTLSQWVNALVAAGLAIEQMCEPRPSAQTVAEHPYLADERRIPLFLIIRCRKA